MKLGMKTHRKIVNPQDPKNSPTPLMRDGKTINQPPKIGGTGTTMRGDHNKPGSPGYSAASTKSGPHANSRTDVAGTKKTANIGAAGKLTSKPESPAVTKRTEAPMSAARKLYPSAK